MMKLNIKTHLIIGMLALGLVGWVVYLIYEPEPVLESRRILLEDKVRRGESLTLETTWKFSRGCGYHLFREVTDAGGTIIFSNYDRRFAEQQPAGVAVTRFVTIPISRFSELGPAVYQTYFAWSCNFIQFTFPMRLQKGEPLKFEIVE
jgi:hypothetical protein